MDLPEHAGICNTVQTNEDNSNSVWFRDVYSPPNLRNFSCIPASRPTFGGRHAYQRLDGTFEPFQGLPEIEI